MQKIINNQYIRSTNQAPKKGQIDMKKFSEICEALFHHITNILQQNTAIQR